MNSQDPLPKKSTNYMYASTGEEIEAKRLEGHNKLHNPHTLKFLRHYLPGKKSLLELGCGSGQLAAEVMNLANPSARFMGIDRDPIQVKRSEEILAPFSQKIKIIQLDLNTELDQLIELGPFDLIYCRWVLVHLPKTSLVNVIRKIIKLLSKDGVFLCDECDNRSVSFKPIAHRQPIAPYQKATRLWLELSQVLMTHFKNDLELTPEKLKDLFLAASQGKGEVRIEGQYQVTLRGADQKKLISDGFRSSATFFSKINKPIEEFIEPFDACTADEAIEVAFLTENVISYCNVI